MSRLETVIHSPSPAAIGRGDHESAQDRHLQLDQMARELCVGHGNTCYGPDLPIASVLEVVGGTAEKEKVVVGSMLKSLDVK